MAQIKLYSFFYLPDRRKKTEVFLTKEIIAEMSQNDSPSTGYKRYESIYPSENFSDEEMVRDWTLSKPDIEEIQKYRKSFRLFIAIQLCCVRLYGRFLQSPHDLSLRIINYLNNQLDLPPSLTVNVPDRKATYLEHRKNVLEYLGFRKFDDSAQSQLTVWIEKQARQGKLPDALFGQAQGYLLANQVLLPGPSVLDKLIVRICSQLHLELFEQIYQSLPADMKRAIDELLQLSDDQQRSFFNQLKQFPPAASITSLRTYLQRYKDLTQTGVDSVKMQLLDPAFQEYLFRLAKRYSAKDLKRFNKYKRHALMICFLLESRKRLLDYLVKMHDQFMLDASRKSRNTYDKKYRQYRSQQKKAMDTILHSTQTLLNWPEEQVLTKKAFWKQVGKEQVQYSLDKLYSFKRFTDRGYGSFLLRRYPSLRKYFAEFIQLPFVAEQGSQMLMQAIDVVRKLDAEELKKLPEDVPIKFVPRELRPLLKDSQGQVNRNAWEMGLALAIKDALRSGDLYLPESKRHVSFWELILSETNWTQIQTSAYTELEQPQEDGVKTELTQQFAQATTTAQEAFDNDDFATIQDGKLKLKRDDKLAKDPEAARLQKVIDASMPFIRIEQLLMEVDRLTKFSQHFKPLQDHRSKPKQFYKTLMAAIISQATNLGVVSMSASMKDTTVEMLRHILHYFIREETLKAANAQIVNDHHKLPLSSLHGTGSISSSDAQRFGIRASSLLASYYPRYYGYYEKAIGIYTHVSDQYSVFSTKVISCGPREALYVLDGLLENNTILQIKKHTVDTHGYTEIIFALCYLLGYYFMPRIRDLKDQQLYRVDKNTDYGVFAPLLNKTANTEIIEEQWDVMIRVAASLKRRTAPAHIVVERLTNSSPSDRLSKAFVNLGRIIKTEYILQYITDPQLRRTVQGQLNKGEYRHRLPRRVFFADQGEFTTGDYEEIMNKASSLSLVSNAILYWNTIKINDIVEGLRQKGEIIKDETLARISLLPYKHVIPNGSYFIDDYQRGF